jgi:hypothetical protein
MTVKELRDHLAQFPDDMEVIETRCSDMGPMDLDSWGVVKAIDVRLRRGYIMHYPENDPRLSSEWYRREIESVGTVRHFLHYTGN